MRRDAGTATIPGMQRSPFTDGSGPGRDRVVGPNASGTRSRQHRAVPGPAACKTPAARRPRRSDVKLPVACVLAGVLAAGAAPAEQGALRAYECVENGVKSFSDQPCGRRAGRVFVGYTAAQAGEPDGAAAQTSRDGAVTPEVSNAGSDTAGDRYALKRAIARAEGRISDLHKERDAEIAALRLGMQDDTAAQRVGADDGPGRVVTTRDLVAQKRAMDRLSEQVRGIKTRYAQEIAIWQERLEALRAQLPETGQPDAIP